MAYNAATIAMKTVGAPEHARPLRPIHPVI